MKKFMLFLATTILALVLVGCGDDDTPTDGDIVLTYAAWNLGSADSDTPNMERLMLDEFEEKYV